MAVPTGYEKIQANTLYENVEYWIDTSVKPTSFSANNYDADLYLGYGEYSPSGAFGVYIYDENYSGYQGSHYFVIYGNNAWSNITDGVVTGYPTLNINLTTSPDWLYVKPSASALYYEPLYEGSELQDSATFTPTTSQQSLTLEQGKVAVKAVTVDAVTASIDSNIQSQNIKLGVTILGVEGNLAEDKPDQSKTVTPTKETQTVTPDSGYELSEVTVNPIPSQYIIPEGTQTITQDGTYDVTNYATVEVNVPNPLLAATDAEMTALTTEANVGKVVKFTGTTGTYQQQRLYLIKSNATLITFTIGGTSYQAEEGMTWEDWVASGYNTGGFEINSNQVTLNYGASEYQYVRPNDGSSMAAMDEIIEGEAYILSTVGGGS